MKKLFLGIICLFFLTTIWSCQPEWSVPKTKADISIGEMFSGATWTADSKKVYFARWVNYGTAGDTAGYNKQLADDKFQVEEKIEPFLSWCPWLALMVDKILWGNIPGPLYNREVIYSYDISNQSVQIIAIIPYRDMSPVFFFSNSLEDNKISFCSAGSSKVHSIDLYTGQDVPVDGDDCRFLKRGPMISAETNSFAITDRYLSPDRHSFIELPSNVIAANEVRIFHDPNVDLKTMAELGSDENLAASTARPGQIQAYQAAMAKILENQATVKISPQQLFTPEELKIRAKYGF